MATVIRVIRYEGTEASVREAIQKSMPLGVRHCHNYTMTIGEHFNDLPELVELTDEEIQQALS